VNQKIKRAVWGKLLLVCQLAVSCALLVGSRDAGAQTSFPSFSADEIRTMRKEVTSGKIYASADAVRTEGERKGKKTISIVRLDKKAIWNLMPNQKMYMELPFMGSADVASMAKDATIEKEPLGSEQVGAYHCDKYRVKATFEGKVYTSIEWEAKELNGFAVKKGDEKGAWTIEYQNVHLGPQDPSLFEVPADYKKVDLGGMFKPRS
jgi:hypothetical protein